MYKARLITLALTLSASPLAFFVARLVLGTKTGSGGDGGAWAV